MSEFHDSRQIYADLPEAAATGIPASPTIHTTPEPRRSPAVGTITLGLAIIVFAVAGLLQVLNGYSPDPRAAAAALLAGFGTLLVVSSGLGLFLHRGGRRLRR